MSLQPLVPNHIWHAQQALMFGPISVTSRMTVVKLSDGSLWIHSPIRPTTALIEALSAIGPVSFVVAPNKSHHLFFLPFLQSFPQAQGFVAPGLTEKRPDLKGFTVLGSVGAAEKGIDMPVPAEYQRASEKFYEYLVDARDISGLWSTHVTYTMTQGVFQVFRRRLSTQDAIAFANVLPICLRALFVTDWHIGEEKRPFESREVMTNEVKLLRQDHNFSTDTAIRDVAEALRRHVDEEAFDTLLAQLPKGAAEFWTP